MGLNTGAELVVHISYSPVTKLWLASARTGCKILSLNVDENTLTEVCKLASETEGKEPEQNFAKYSPDASMIVTGGTDGLLKLWKTSGASEEPTLQRTCGSKAKEVLDADFSPDGLHVAACDGSGNCRLWEVAKDEPVDGKLVTFTSSKVGGKAAIKLVRFLPSTEGKLAVMLGASGTQRKMQSALIGMFSLDGDKLAEVVVDKLPIKSLALSTDNGRLVVGLMSGAKSVH